MPSRLEGLVPPGVVVFHDARVFLRIEEKGRNVGILVETPDGRRHVYLVERHPLRLGAVSLTEVAP